MNPSVRPKRSNLQVLIFFKFRHRKILSLKSFTPYYNRFREIEPRPQDVLDIAVALNRGANLRPDVVADFLRRKAASRNVEVSLNLFLAE